ncbi:MAG: cation transporter [Phycisphaerae bacterium]
MIMRVIVIFVATGLAGGCATTSPDTATTSAKNTPKQDRQTAPAAPANKTTTPPVTANAIPSQTSNATPNLAILQVNGMSCPLCAHNIDLQLQKIDGVGNVAVDLGTGEVRVQTTKPVARDAMVAAIDEAGYTVKDYDSPAETGKVWAAHCQCKACNCGATSRCEAGCVCAS